MKTTTLVLVRHGESEWNKKNLFTGWTDVNLSETGVKEAKKAGKELKKKGFVFDRVYTSLLKRSIHTSHYILEEMDQLWIPVKRSWRINERHYGALQGLNKAQTAKKYGDEQVHIWRRSFDIAPPSLKKSDKRYPGKDPKYQSLESDQIPTTESLKDTIARALPYWQDEISQHIRKGEKVLIAAHGNSLRALVKHLEGISNKDILELNIPTGVPLVYELNDKLKPVKKYYLGEKTHVKKQLEKGKKHAKGK